MSRRIAWAVVTATVVVIPSCVGGDTLSLDEGFDADDPRFDRLRSALAIEVRPGVGSYAGSDSCTQTSDEASGGTPCCRAGAYCSAAGLANILDTACRLDRTPGRAGFGPDPGACASAVVQAEYRVCVAQRLLQIVEEVAPMELVVHRSGAGTVTQSLVIPPQDAESNSELALQAIAAASEVTRNLGQVLATTSTCSHAALISSAAASPTTQPLATLTLGEELASFYAEATQIVLDAGDHVGLTGTAVSDHELSRATDPSEAALMRLAPFASRAASAHALLGGAHGLPGFAFTTGATGQGLFTLPRLSRNGQQALQLLRSLAPAPWQVIDTSITNANLVGTSSSASVPTTDTLRYRFARSTDEMSTTGAADLALFYARVGITDEGLTEARAWIAQEIRAFDRPALAPGPGGAFVPRAARTLPPDRLPSGDPSDYVVYAATRLEASQPPDAFWSALIRYDDTPRMFSTFSNTRPPFTFVSSTTGAVPPGYTWGDEATSGTALVAATRRSGRTAASLFAEAVERANSLLPALTPTTSDAGATVTALTHARASLARVVSMSYGGPPPPAGSVTPQADIGLAGHARACWSQTWSPATDTVTVELVGAGTSGFVATQLAVYFGHEGLECATAGTIDGTPCTAADLNAYRASITTATAATARPTVTITLTPRMDVGPRSGTTELYVVRGIVPTVVPQPGTLHAVGGFVLQRPVIFVLQGSPPPPDGFRYCIQTPLTPSLDHEAATLIAPSTQYAAQSATSCGGVSDDLRLPLENELTEDFNDVESSWRHYLSVAQSAADLADSLGEDLVRTGLEMDLRAEAQADELERLCGVRVSVTSFATSLPPAVAAPTGTSTCASGYVYVTASNQCVLDPIAWAESSGAVTSEDAQRLRECIGSDSTVPWVTLGDQPVCLWDYPGVSNSVCLHADERHPCPAIRLGAIDESACSVPTSVAGARRIFIPQSNALALFRVPDPTQTRNPVDTLDLPCAQLARARAGGSSASVAADADPDFRDVASSSLFDLGTFADWARQLSVEPAAGDYLRVTFAGTTVATTGAYALPGADPILLWPAGHNFGGASVLATDGLCPSGSSIPDPLGRGASPLFCVADVSGTSAHGRARANDMLARAVIAARVISGTSLQGVRLPFYPRTSADEVSVDDSRWGPPQWQVVTGSLYRGDTGSLGIDHHTTGDTADPVVVDFNTLGARAARFTDSATVLWTRCPWESSICDEALTVNTSASHRYSLPFLARALAGGVERADAQRLAGPLFRVGSDQGWLLQLLRRAHDRQLSDGDMSTSRLALNDFGTGTRVVELRALSDYFAAHGTRPDGCHDDSYNDCTAHEGDIDFRATWDGNLAHVESTGGGLSYGDILNGVELTCAAARASSPDANFGCSDPAPEIHSLRDLLSMDSFLRCKADAIATMAGTSVVQDVPTRVVESLHATGPAVYGTDGGEIGAQVTDLRAAYRDLSDQQYAMADSLRGMAASIRELRVAIGRSEIANEIEDIQLTSTIFNQVTSCAVGMAEAASNAVGKFGNASGFVGAGISCANSAVQIGLAAQLTSLRERDQAMALEGTFASFDAQATQRSREISERANSIQTALDRIAAAITRINGIRNEGRTALQRALFLTSGDRDTHFAVSSVYRARYDTLLARYREAHETAVRSAVIARRAVEQRLAMPLDTMTDDLPTVAAPATWADEICTLPSIDYDQLRGATPGTTGDRGSDSSSFPGPEGYSGAFVGDYVRRLQNVVESYNFAFPFRDGTDQVVLSLRDDVFRARADCPAETPNLLYQTDAMEVGTRTDGSGTGWDRVGCDGSLVVEPPSGELPDSSCILVEQIPASDAAGFGRTDAMGGTMPARDATLLPGVLGDDSGRPVAYRLRFGGSPVATANASLAQSVTLPEGRYRVSWYGRTTGDAGFVDPRDVLSVRSSGGPLYAGSRGAHPPVVDGVASGAVADGWHRFHYFFDVPTTVDVAVTIAPPSVSTSSTSTVDIAGVMLESANSVEGDPWRSITTHDRAGDAHMAMLAEVAGPAPYFGTTDVLERVLRACSDTTGASFRSEAWTYGCTRVCPDGYDGTCDDRIATSRCYWQTSFGVSGDDLQRMLTSTPTGFASGNFNYRVQSIAVNLVGTGVRDCSDGGSTCYGSGSVSFSLLHSGPFTVRNARGETYDAPLFPGRMESARALAAERYVTNPVSGADQSLLGPYTRADFIGRPLGGTMILRIWDEPTLVWSHVEDVQLVIGYRYWQQQR